MSQAALNAKAFNCALMESLPIPPITRFDAVMWFLRVYLWISVVYGITAVLRPIFYLIIPAGSMSLWSPAFIFSAVPVFLLWLFPSLLATNALGESARDAVQASDLKFLVGRCVGLALFVGSLGRVAFYSFAIAYSVATSVARLLPSTTSALSVLFVEQLGPTILAFVLGFFLAFGPALRGATRPR